MSPIDWSDPEQVRAYKRAWYARNRERELARQRARRGDALRAYDRGWRRANYNAQAKAARNRADYQASKEQRRAWQSQWRRANPALVNAQARRRRERRAGADHSDRPGPTYELLLASDPCAYCGAPPEVIDHITALADNGTGNVDNLTAACTSCNASKGARRLLPFLLSRLEVTP